MDWRNIERVVSKQTDSIVNRYDAYPLSPQPSSSFRSPRSSGRLNHNSGGHVDEFKSPDRQSRDEGVDAAQLNALKSVMEEVGELKRSVQTVATNQWKMESHQVHASSEADSLRRLTDHTMQFMRIVNESFVTLASSYRQYPVQLADGSPPKAPPTFGSPTPVPKDTPLPFPALDSRITTTTSHSHQTEDINKLRLEILRLQEDRKHLEDQLKKQNEVINGIVERNVIASANQESNTTDHDRAELNTLQSTVKDLEMQLQQVKKENEALQLANASRESQCRLIQSEVNEIKSNAVSMREELKRIVDRHEEVVDRPTNESYNMDSNKKDSNVDEAQLSEIQNSFERKLQKEIDALRREFLSSQTNNGSGATVSSVEGDKDKSSNSSEKNQNEVTEATAATLEVSAIDPMPSHDNVHELKHIDSHLSNRVDEVLMSIDELDSKFRYLDQRDGMRSDYHDSIMQVQQETNEKIDQMSSKVAHITEEVCSKIQGKHDKLEKEVTVLMKKFDALESETYQTQQQMNKKFEEYRSQTTAAQHSASTVVDVKVETLSKFIMQHGTKLENHDLLLSDVPDLQLTVERIDKDLHDVLVQLNMLESSHGQRIESLTSEVSQVKRSESRKPMARRVSFSADALAADSHDAGDDHKVVKTPSFRSVQVLLEKDWWSGKSASADYGNTEAIEDPEDLLDDK